MTEQTTDRRHDQRYDDEIDLRDLALTLVRRKWLILAVAGLCILMGLGYGATRLPAHLSVVTTTIGIGEVMDAEGKISTMESVNAVRDRLNNVWIKQIAADYERNHPGPKVQLEAKSDDPSIILESIGPKKSEQRHMSFHQLITDFLLEQLDEITEIRRTEIEFELEIMKMKRFHLLNNEDKRIKTQLQAIENEERIIKDQISQYDIFLLSAHSLLKKTMQEVNNDESRALTRLMVVNDYFLNLDRKYQLKRMLEVNMPEKKQALKEEIALYGLEKQKIEKELELFTIRQESLKPTRIISSPSVSSTVVEGRGLHFYFALSLVAGLMLGVFAAFFAEFIAGVRARMRETGGK